MVDMVDETIELTVEDNIYSYSESYELLDELQKACTIIKTEKSETYSEQMQCELEPIETNLQQKFDWIEDIDWLEDIKNE